LPEKLATATMAASAATTAAATCQADERPLFCLREDLADEWKRGGISKIVKDNAGSECQNALISEKIAPPATGLLFLAAAGACRFIIHLIFANQERRRNHAGCENGRCDENALQSKKSSYDSGRLTRTRRFLYG
jgi:hypothetical protein